MVTAATFAEGDTVAILAGSLAHRKVLSYPGVVLAVSLGAALSDQLWYWIGRIAVRRAWVQRRLRSRGAAPLMRTVERRPDLAMLGFRFVLGTRAVVPLALGATGVSAVRFTVLDAVAVLAWAVLLTGAGFGAGVVIEGLLGRLELGRHLLLILLCAFAVLGATLLLRDHWPKHARDEP